MFLVTVRVCAHGMATGRKISIQIALGNCAVALEIAIELDMDSRRNPHPFRDENPLCAHTLSKQKT